MFSAHDLYLSPPAIYMTVMTEKGPKSKENPISGVWRVPCSDGDNIVSITSYGVVYSPSVASHRTTFLINITCPCGLCHKASL